VGLALSLSLVIGYHLFYPSFISETKPKAANEHSCQWAKWVHDNRTLIGWASFSVYLNSIQVQIANLNGQNMNIVVRDWTECGLNLVTEWTDKD
jgi:hypothetical protein